jgi:methylaspartate mutase epsilon subunit
VKYVILRCRQTLNLFQDIAKAKALQELAAQYMKKFGHNDVELFLGFEDWVAAFPPDWAQASGLVAMGAVSAHFTGAQNIMIKSLDEGLGLPTNDAVVFSLRETKQVLNSLKHQKFPFSREVEDEKNMIKKEATLIMEKVLELGDGDVAIGCIKAIDAGVIDHPFSSSVYNAGKVFPTRDANGMVRYLNTGNLPFTREIIEYHQQKVNERKKIEKIEKDYLLMLEDISSFTRDV